MKLSIISFTKNGMLLSQRLAKAVSDGEIKVFTKYRGGASDNEEILFVEAPLGEWAAGQLWEKRGLLFIGACGIAVRAVAPYITDKLHDSPVLVMDEKGVYVIPLLSGHFGGANEAARRIAEKTGAIPVITTATDLNGCFAADLFAKRNDLAIENKEGIAKISAGVLEGKEIVLSIEPGHFSGGNELSEGICLVPYPPKAHAGIIVSSENRPFDAELVLRPKEYVLGMGCKKGTGVGKIEALIAKSLAETGIPANRIYALASIEKKKEEEGFIAWSRRNGVPFFTYSAKQLWAVGGSFRQSAFVMAQVGVDNVCERAALSACGAGGTLVYEKHAEDGMTIAIARREWSVTFDEEYR